MPTRIWLVSDTRVTQGAEHSDDLIKSVTINQFVTGVAAGGVGTAAYILRQLKMWARPDTTISEVRSHLEEVLPGLIKSCVNETGFMQETKMIVGGYDPSRKKRIPSGRLGEFMSAEVKIAGEGRVVEQSIDPKIVSALTSAIQKHDGLPGHMPIEIDYPHSELLRIETQPREPYFTLKRVPVFRFVAFHPGWETFSILVPPERLARFGVAPPDVILQSIYDVSASLMTVVNEQASTHGMASVGGNIIPLLLDPDRGAVFATGDIAHVQPDGSIETSSFTVEGEKYRYRLRNGSTGYYRLLEQIDLPGDAEISLSRGGGVGASE